MSRREKKKNTVYLYTDEEVNLFRIDSSINPRTKRKIKKGGKIYNYLMSLIVRSDDVASRNDGRSPTANADVRGSKEKNKILEQGEEQGELIMLNNPPKQIIKKLRENSLVPN